MTTDLVESRLMTTDLAALLRSTTERAIRYFDGLEHRGVAPSAEAVGRLAAFREALPEDPADPEAVLALLDEYGSPATMAMTGPRFFGFVIGGALPATLAANWLATAWDQNTGLHTVTPGTAVLEQVALEWLVSLLGLPKGTGCAFVTGATVANLTALAAARHAVLERAGWNVEADGLFGAPPVTVILGDEVHPSVRKSLGILGLGRNRVVTVPVDDQGRMRAEALPRLSGPTIILTQAGNVNTGAFDPLAEICRRAAEAGAWVHVDGAFGLWAAACADRAHLAGGMALADSWATDAHKWLNVPYDSGIAFVRQPDTLRAAMAITAEYLPLASGEQRNPSDFTPELSRRARGVDVWAALRSLGRRGLSDMIERSCRQARLFASELAGAGFEILNDVVLNQVLVSFGSSEINERVIADLQTDGTCWAGRTVWQGRSAMRISVSCWATTDEDVHLSVAAMRRVAARYGPSARPR